ncbi:MAG: hypothetical protein ACI4B5_01625 [Bacteroidaceae bacterium]
MGHITYTGRLLPLIALLAAGLLGSCDSGDITEGHITVNGTGHNVKLTADLQGPANLPAGYALSLAGFQEGNNYAVMQRTITMGTEEGHMEMTLSNIGTNVHSVELAVTNNLRERILSLAQVKPDEYKNTSDTIYLDIGVLDVSNTGCLQRGMLDQACVQCHGANGYKAANLDLTAGNTSANLVNVPCSTMPGVMRVSGGKPEESLLWNILNEGGENILRHNHTEIISSHFKENLLEVRTYLRKWIEAQPTPTDK